MLSYPTSPEITLKNSMHTFPLKLLERVSFEDTLFPTCACYLFFYEPKEEGKGRRGHGKGWFAER